MEEKLSQIDEGKLKKINGKIYVEDSDLVNLVKKPNKDLIRVLFLQKDHIQILHDTPVLGATRERLYDSFIEGPYFSEEEVNKEKEKEINFYRKLEPEWWITKGGNISSIDKDIHLFTIEKVIKKEVVENSNPTKYIRNISSKIYNGKKNSHSKRIEDSKKINAVYDRLIKGIKEICDKEKKIIRKSRFNEIKSSIFLLDNTFLQVDYNDHYDGFPWRMFSIKVDSFGDKTYNLSWTLYKIEEELGLGKITNFRHNVLEKQSTHRYITLNPIKLNLEYNSVSDILEKNEIF